jgi:precorrin-8X/cobalt-precorrin-8 methylmutase
VGYLRDPEEIYRASFAAIRRAVDIDGIPGFLQPVILRLVHACGRPEIVAALRWSGDPAGAAHTALAQGAPIIVDATMVAAGITESRLSAGNRVICTLRDDRVADLARQNRITRSAAAVDLWLSDLQGAVVAIGNAPTALFRLLELLALPETPRPAALFAFPVGFIGAAEAKDALVAADAGVPYLTLAGREGGSALAAAAINAVVRGAD